MRVARASLPRIGEVTVDLRAALVSLGVAVAGGLLVGLAPAMHARRDALAETLRSGTAGARGTARHRLRRALVTAETALAVIVVVGAGLLLRTVRNLTVADTGFDRSRLVTFAVTLPPAGFDVMGRVRAYQTLLDRLRGVPGVRAASAMTSLPLDRQFVTNETELTDGATASQSPPTIDYQRVMSGFFEAMGVPILKGRAFQAADAASRGYVTVVNETLAKTYWSGRNPIGERLRPAGTGPWFTVIGVAKDVAQTGVDRPVRPEAYVLVEQLATDAPTTWLAVSPPTLHVAVRTTLPLETLAPAIARVVRQIDPALPVAGLRPMDEVFRESIRGPRLLAQLLALFSALALALAAVGTYGVLAVAVAARRRELGIRLALGAGRARLLQRVIAEGLTPAGVGVAAGLAAAGGLTRLVRSLLFGVEPADAMTLTMAVGAVVGVAALASWLPAWRASRLDPNAVLRAE
jgi:predicted permease